MVLIKCRQIDQWNRKRAKRQTLKHLINVIAKQYSFHQVVLEQSDIYMFKLDKKDCNPKCRMQNHKISRK